MSRVVTPSMTPPATAGVKVPHDKIAMRAYEKWMKRGCTHGNDMKDWVEAEAELRAEYAKGSPNMSRR